MTDLNPALVGQQQPPTNLEWPPTNSHNRAGRLSPSAEKAPNWVLPSKSGQVGKGLKANSKEETKHDTDYNGHEIANMSHPGHLRPPNHHDRLDNGVVEPNEQPKSRQDYVQPHEDINQRIIQPPGVSPIMGHAPMGNPMPPLQMSPAKEKMSSNSTASPLKGASNQQSGGSSNSKMGESETSKLSANAPVFQPSQKKDGALWDYHPSKSSRGGRSGSMDGSDVYGARGVGGNGGGNGHGPTGHGAMGMPGGNRLGKAGASGVMATQEDRTLQKLNLVYPNGPTPETAQFLQTRGPKAPRYEYLSSATTWLPGQNHTFDWAGFVYTLAQPIHMGMNGHIHHCSRQQRTPTGEVAARKKNVAAKVVPNTPAFEREIIILRALQQDCNNIIKLRDVIELPTCLISIMELAQTDVHQFFAGRSAKQHGWRLDKTATREYFARMVVNDVVHGLKQMHERRYLHCDLKAQNILMFIWRSSRKGGSYVQAKLTDFGHSWKGQVRMAERLFPNGMARVGTAGHVAPELFVEGSACGPKIDIWSLGVVMFSMLVPGHLPFGEYSNLSNLRKVYDLINNPDVPFSDNSSWSVLFNSCSPEARDLILWMTRMDPHERPDEDAILNHPWFHISRGIKDTTGYRSKLQYWNGMSHFSRAYE